MKNRIVIIVLSIAVVASLCGNIYQYHNTVQLEQQIDNSNISIERLQEDKDDLVKQESVKAKPVSKIVEEKPVERKKDELKTESVESKKDEPVHENEEESEIIEGLDEYLSSIDNGTYGMSDHGTYHVCYYADDINEDGYPEVFQYRYKDRSADGREYSLILHYMSRFWNDEERRWKYFSKIEYFGLVENTFHVMSSEFGSDQIMLSYTRGQDNIYVKWDYATLKKHISNKELKVFRDSEIFFGGFATMEKIPEENGEGFVKYLAQDTSYRYYEDEEHFNSFDSDSIYETTIVFGETELWPTYQEALDHLGEIRQLTV